MTNRVVVGALPGGGHGLRVSRPGFNVLTPGLTGKELAFDSRWTTAARLYTRGTLTLPVVTPVSYYTLSYGTTFPVIPPVLIMRRQSSGSTWQLLDATLHNTWTQGSTGFEPARIYTDRMEIQYPSSSILGSFEYSYMVLRPF